MVLTVKQLIDLVSKYPEDAQVMIHNTDGSGDLEFMTLRPCLESHPAGETDDMGIPERPCMENNDAYEEMQENPRDPPQTNQNQGLVYLLPDFGGPTRFPMKCCNEWKLEKIAGVPDPADG